MSHIFHHPNGIYSLVIPDDWQHEMRGSSVIFSKGGDLEGAMVVSCVAPPLGQSPDPIGFIQDFVEKKLPPEGDEARIVDLASTKQGIRIAYTRYHARRDHWRIWVLSNQDRLLFVTYNCAPTLKGNQDAVVDGMIASIQLPKLSPQPLLRPSRHPQPGILTNMLGISGHSIPCNLPQFDVATTRILSALQALTSADRAVLEDQLDEQDASLRTYYLERRLNEDVGSVGIVTLAYGNKQGYSLGCKLLWSGLSHETDALTVHMDRLWDSERWCVLYAYDQDDHSLQNLTTLMMLEDFGLVRDQVELINRFGIVDEIDTRGNPGYTLNHDGLLWSVQWLSYWSARAQEKMFTTPPRKFPAGVEVKDLGQGAIRVRLSEKPGRFDDVEFHKRQLECRRGLPFAAPFRLRED